MTSRVMVALGQSRRIGRQFSELPARDRLVLPLNPVSAGNEPASPVRLLRCVAMPANRGEVTNFGRYSRKRHGIGRPRQTGKAQFANCPEARHMINLHTTSTKIHVGPLLGFKPFFKNAINSSRLA